MSGQGWQGGGSSPGHALAILAGSNSGKAEAARAHIPGSGKERGRPTRDKTRGGDQRKPSPPQTINIEQIRNCQAYSRRVPRDTWPLP